MKTCKVRPSLGTCHECLDADEMYGMVSNCSKCSLHNVRYELLQIGTSFWSGDYAMVQKDGKIEKVSLNRVYDVKEEP